MAFNSKSNQTQLFHPNLKDQARGLAMIIILIIRNVKIAQKLNEFCVTASYFMAFTITTDGSRFL
jgi:hypothetical protein